eukprot:362280-Chlamydomonas_euryale.AAC.2
MRLDRQHARLQPRRRRRQRPPLLWVLCRLNRLPLLLARLDVDEEALAAELLAAQIAAVSARLRRHATAAATAAGRARADASGAPCAEWAASCVAAGLSHAASMRLASKRVGPRNKRRLCKHTRHTAGVPTGASICMECESRRRGGASTQVSAEAACVRMLAEAAGMLAEAAGILAGAAGMLAGAAGMLAGAAGILAGAAGMLAEAAGMLAGAAGMLAEAAGMLAEAAGMLAGAAGIKVLTGVSAELFRITSERTSASFCDSGTLVPPTGIVFEPPGMPAPMNCR